VDLDVDSNGYENGDGDDGLLDGLLDFGDDDNNNEERDNDDEILGGVL
jgi:hypothetical protein